MQCIALGVPVILRYRTSRGKERAGRDPSGSYRTLIARAPAVPLTDHRDLPAGDADIDKTAIGQAAIGQECVDLRYTPPLTHSFVFWGMLKARNDRSITAGSSPRAMNTRRERRSASGHPSR